MKERQRKWFRQIYGKVMKLKDSQTLDILDNGDMRNLIVANKIQSGFQITPRAIGQEGMYI